MAITKDQVLGAVRVCQAVAEAIREVRRVPAGHLYSAMMEVIPDLGAFDKIIGTLEGAGLVERTCSHELVWIGPGPQLAAV